MLWWSIFQVVSILAPLENFNQTHQEIITQQGPYTANIRDYRSIYSKIKWKRKKIGKKNGNFEKHDEIYFDRTFDFADFVIKHGHKIGHMVKKCHWKAQKCGPENFTSVLTDFGLCYTFNPGTLDHELLKVHRAGVDLVCGYNWMCSKINIMEFCETHQDSKWWSTIKTSRH